MKEKERVKESEKERDGKTSRDEGGGVHDVRSVIDRDKKYDRKEKTRYGCWWSH